jgi:type IV pilus assembly protein PilE
MAAPRKSRGLTLIELMVALVIAATLAALAVPGFRAQLLRAHRIEAMEALLTLASAQERFHLDHGRYATRLATTDEPGLALAATTATARYRLSIREADGVSYTALAQPAAGRGQEADARCAEFEITASGRRSARDAAGRDSSAECWR